MMLNHLLLGQSLLRQRSYAKQPRVPNALREQWRTFLHRRRMARMHQPHR